MTIVRWFAVLLAFLVLCVVLLNSKPMLGAVLPVPEPRVYLVERFTLEDAFKFGGAVAVMPSRAGRVGENWTFEDTLRTGSRSPVPATAPRWTGKWEQIESVADVPVPGLNESVVLIGLPEQVGASKFIPVALRNRYTFEQSLLTSGSTRNQPGLIASTDMATTLDSQSIGAGQKVRLKGRNLGRLQAQVAVWEAQHRALKFLKFVPWGLAGLLLLAAWQRWVWLKHIVLAYPLGLLVVPALGVREGWIYIAAALIAGGIAALGPRGMKAASWATVLVVVLDMALGGWVSARTPLSYSPIEAARFYGIGNEIEGYVIGAALIAGAGDVIVTVLLGAVVSMMLGAPMLGADFGGFLTSIVAFSVAALLLTKKEERKTAAVALIALALLSTFLLVRSSTSTHVGRAAAGGGEGRGIVIARKLAMNAHLTLTSPWALLALVQLVLLWRHKKNPALLVGAGSVWAVNDSGIVAAALLLLWHEKAPGAIKTPEAASEVAT